MTIRPGAPWGSEVPRPDGLVTVGSDRSLAAALACADGPPIAVGSGDLARTFGVSSQEQRAVDRATVIEFPIDLLQVRLGDAGEPVLACAHVIVRSPWTRGHWFRGPILAVMNAEFFGDWDVAPRGHPNDGRAEVVAVDESMSVRHRLAARRRMHNGTHLPHPQVVTRSIRSGNWNFAHPLEVIVDGHRLGRAADLTVEVLPDAAIVYA